MRAKIPAALGLLTLPLLSVAVVDACSLWQDENALGDAGGPSVVCPGPVSVSIPAAFAVASASGSTSVSMSGTATGCTVFGVSLYGAVAAASVGSSYASWTASVPLTTFESQAGGACAAGSYFVPMQVLVTQDSGVNGWITADAGCVSLLTDMTCMSPTATLTSAYAAPASSTGSSVTVAGTANDPGCPIAGLTLANAYPATPVVPGFGAWTATLPLSAFEGQSACTIATGAGPVSGFSIPIQVLVPGSTGLSEWVTVASSGCVPLSSNLACSALTASLTSAYPAPSSSSSGPTVLIAGTANDPGCPVAGVTVANVYPATAVVPGFGAWTATIPLTALEAQPACPGDQGYAVPVEVLVPGATGVSEWQPVNAGCVALAPAAAACDAGSVSVNSWYAAPAAASSAPSLTLGGTMTAPGCPVSAMTLLGAYPATAVGSSLAAWTAVVPIAAIQSQPGSCTSDGGATGYPISAQLLVPGATGLNVVETIPAAGCVPVQTVPLPGCVNPTVTLSPGYVVPASSSSANVVFGGNVQTGPCPVSGLVVMGAYSATPVGTSYAAWTATVPEVVALAQPSAPCPAPSPGTSNILVPVQVLVPGLDGLPVAEAVDAGCLTIMLDASATGH